MSSCNDDDVIDSEITVEPYGKEFRYSGRIVAVTIFPSNNQRMLAASPSGGLFQSDNGGRSWSPLATDKQWSYALQDVEFVPFDPNIVIASSRKDLNTVPNGGIWRSDTAGFSFERPTSGGLPPSRSRCPIKTGAYAISFDESLSRIYVGTDCGYAWSDDSGLTWRYKIINPNLAEGPKKLQDRVYNIAGAGQNLYAITSDGIYFSINGGTNWTKSTGTYESVGISMAVANAQLAVFPDNSRVALMALDDYLTGADDTTPAPGVEFCNLFITYNGGATWGILRTRTDTGREGLVRITPLNYKNPRGGGYTIYYGNGETVERGAISNTSMRAFRTIEWESVNADHKDVNDLAFDPITKAPRIMANDGGIELNLDNNGSTFRTPRASAADRETDNLNGIPGLRALQVYRAIGQMKYNGSAYEHSDIYVGTHDNKLWYSKDDGANWGPFNYGPEGSIYGILPKITDYDNSWIPHFSCWACFKKISEPYFKNNRNWTSPGTKDKSYHVVKNNNEMLQFGELTTAVSQKTSLYYSDNLDTNWQLIVDLDKPIWGYGLPQQSNPDRSWITVGVRDGTNSNGDSKLVLRSISNVDDPTTATLYGSGPDLKSLGFRGYQFVWTPIFGVSPESPNHIIAPDIEDLVMKYSLDGGVTWEPDAALTTLLTHEGVYDFYSQEVGRSLVTEISFQPENPNHILIGSRLGGIVISNDGGISWKKVAHTEQIPHITSFFWDTPNNQVIVSSYGRGLWVLKFTDGYLEKQPEIVRTPKPINPDRIAINRVTTNLTQVGIFGVNAANNNLVNYVGQTLEVDGTGFLENTNYQGPVSVMVDGKHATYAFPNPEGYFKTEVDVYLDAGEHTITALQEGGPEGKIIAEYSFMVVTNRD